MKRFCRLTDQLLLNDDVVLCNLVNLRFFKKDTNDNSSFDITKVPEFGTLMSVELVSKGMMGHGRKWNFVLQMDSGEGTYN